MGVLLRVVNAYYPNNPGSRYVMACVIGSGMLSLMMMIFFFFFFVFRFIVLVKALHRVEIKSRHDHEILNFPMANVVRYLDLDELEASQVAPELMRQLPALVDDQEAEAGKDLQMQSGVLQVEHPGGATENGRRGVPR